MFCRVSSLSASWDSSTSPKTFLISHKIDLTQWPDVRPIVHSSSSMICFQGEVHNTFDTPLMRGKLLSKILMAPCFVVVTVRSKGSGEGQEEC